VGRGGNRVAQQWRIRWRIARDTGFPLFETPIAEWSNNQVRFAYWMEFYDSIYQSEDCPDDFIINNNHLLDRWFEAKIEEQKAYRRNLVLQKRGMSTRSAFQHDTVTIF
jgi:hypothetical protein